MYIVREEIKDGYKIVEEIDNEEYLIQYLDYIIRDKKPNHKIVVHEYNIDYTNPRLYYLYKGNYTTSRVEWREFKQKYNDRTRIEKIQGRKR